MAEVREAQFGFRYVGPDGSLTIDGVELFKRITDALRDLQVYVTGTGNPDLATRVAVLTNTAGEAVVLSNVTQDATIVVTGNAKLRLTQTAFYAQEVYDATTASAANVVVLSDGQLLRSTSSARFKRDVADYEGDIIGVLRPVRFKSGSEFDDPEAVFVGFTAENVAAADPRLATFDENGQPDAVQYDRLTVPLVAEAQRMRARMARLETRIAAMEARLVAALDRISALEPGSSDDPSRD